MGVEAVIGTVTGVGEVEAVGDGEMGSKGGGGLEVEAAGGGEMGSKGAAGVLEHWRGSSWDTTLIPTFLED